MDKMFIILLILCCCCCCLISSSGSYYYMNKPIPYSDISTTQVTTPPGTLPAPSENSNFKSTPSPIRVKNCNEITSKYPMIIHSTKDVPSDVLDVFEKNKCKDYMLFGK
jgi:hypothetical protein